ncbi:MAG: hypothetical protein IK116_02675 [Firmicutes bacterium]|nr:hypothetical protein [Bacillota bacterium]
MERPTRRRQRQQQYQQQYQQQQQQFQQQQQYQQQYRQLSYQQPPEQQPPAVPRSAAELRQLLEVYGPWLTAENRAFINELLARLESGGDAAGLLELAQSMQQAANRGREPGDGGI